MTEGSDSGTTMAAEAAPKRRNWRKAKAENAAKAVVAPNSRPNMPPGRVRIVLEDSDSIPRGGQFFGFNGASFILKPGVEANVPQGIVNILNDAVTHTPVVDPDTLKVVDWRRKLRHPYRVVPTAA